jgi:nucleotide-binding universal stress UspA family protein
MIRDILLPLTSYPIATDRRAIENVVALAGGVEALVRAVAFEADIVSPIGLYADPVGVRGILAADRKKSAENAHALIASFTATARERGIEHDHRLLRAKPLEIPSILVEEARFCDIAAVAIPGEDAAEQDIAEKLAFESGRPVLVFPEDPKRLLPASIDRVAVAFDCSGPATRAVSDALPFLKRAKEVRIFAVIDDKPTAKPQAAAKLAAHLARHGVTAVAEDVTSDGRAVGEVFGAYVGEHRADLLVMGAYGHSRLREFILGGATKSILQRPPTWVLLSH